MYNNTAPVPLWYSDLTAIFKNNVQIRRRLCDIQLPSFDFSALRDWPKSTNHLVYNAGRAYRDLLELLNDNSYIVLCLAFILIFSLFLSVLLLWRRLQKELQYSRVRVAESKQLDEKIQEERRLKDKLKQENDAQSQKLSQLQATLTQTQSSLTTQRNAHTQQLAKTQSVQDNLKRQKDINQGLMIAATDRNKLVKSLQTDLLSFKTRFATQSNLVKAYVQEIADLKVDRDLLGAIDGRVPSVSKFNHETFSSFATPFVLVVIDGDAYSWSASHFNQPNMSAGHHAAHSIKLEVQRYLLQNKERIPLHSKIVTRVFTNLGDSHHMQSAIASFPRQFTESMPLFDYVDCGRGKERADSKIQELVHLFVANEHCHAIFFAAVIDNGFARLLEQYACVPAAKDKIVLVDPGFVAYEIADLQYKSMRWPTVFGHRSMNPDSQAKCRRIKSRRKQDDKVLNAVAARELVLRLSNTVTSVSSPKMGIGSSSLNWHTIRGKTC